MSRISIVSLLLFTVMMLFVACDGTSPLDPGSAENGASAIDANSLAKSHKKVDESDRIEPADSPIESSDSDDAWSLTGFFDGIKNPVYPQTKSVTLEFDKEKGVYKGGFIYLSNGAFLGIREGALTPPAGTPKGAPVTITMTAELDTLSGEIIYSFSPHGSTFEPYAHLTLMFADLNLGDAVEAVLYYLDDAGNYVETFPDLLDRFEHLMRMEIPHFSRYAIAHSQ